MLTASLSWLALKATEGGVDFGVLFTGPLAWTAHQANSVFFFLCSLWSDSQGLN